MTLLYLVRHGRTEWNNAGRLQGQSDPPLNERGRQQAREAATALEGIPFQAVYSSDLRRARQTAQELVERTGLPLRFDRRLREIALGEWEGLTAADIASRWPDLWEVWARYPSRVRPPGGESLLELETRVRAALDEIASRHEGVVAVFTHLLPIALLRCRARGRPLDRIWELLPENATWEVLPWPLP
ncbi:MAG: histidine phosphatase family protein, partial [Chloroflexia bacterium]